MLALAICPFAIVSVIQAQQPPDPPSLANVGRVSIDLGYPRLNLGYPTQTVIDPEVGRVVRLAQGFGQTPDFTYSFTHPLSQYENPLVNRGPFGTFNSPLEPAPDTNNRLKLKPPVPTQPPSGLSAGPHDPPVTVNFLPTPWHIAAENAKYLPKLEIFAHHATDQPIKGAYVTGISVDGVGHRAGLLPGDVITSINGKELTSGQIYTDVMKELTTPWSLQVWNSHTNRTNTIDWSGQQTTP
jgi:hypothetical protein